MARGSTKTQGQQHSLLSFKYKHCLLVYSVMSSRVVVGGRVVVVVFLSFFFPFLSALGFLVALGSFGSLFFFLSFFFLPSSGALFTLPRKPGKTRRSKTWRVTHSYVENELCINVTIYSHVNDITLSYSYNWALNVCLFPAKSKCNTAVGTSRQTDSFQWSHEDHQHFLLRLSKVLSHFHGKHCSVSISCTLLTTSEF